MKLQPPPPTLDSPLPGRTARRAYVMMLVSAVSFAAMSECARAAGQGIGDWRIAAVARGGVVLMFALAVARVRGTRLTWRGSPTLWVRSITGSVAMLLTFFALTHHVNVATALTLTNTFPIWVTLLAWPVLRERPNRAATVAILCGIAGVCLIERPDLGVFRGTSVAALGAAFCTAVVMLGLHRLKNLDALAIVVHFSAVATVVCAGYTVVTALAGQPVALGPLLEPTNLALLAGIGLFATTGQIFMTEAFKTAAPQRLAVIGLSQVVFALGLDYLLWHHTVQGLALAGILLVIAPVAWLLLKQRG
ncbi:MAG: DMT family transporter [Gemmataceae bacterium]